MPVTNNGFFINHFRTGFGSQIRLTHIRDSYVHPAVETGRSENELFVIDDNSFGLFSLEEHQWRIIPNQNIGMRLYCSHIKLSAV